jgi:hypothetical protein
MVDRAQLDHNGAGDRVALSNRKASHAVNHAVYLPNYGILSNERHFMPK